MKKIVFSLSLLLALGTVSAQVVRTAGYATPDGFAVLSDTATAELVFEDEVINAYVTIDDQAKAAWCFVITRSDEDTLVQYAKWAPQLRADDFLPVSVDWNHLGCQEPDGTIDLDMLAPVSFAVISGRRCVVTCINTALASTYYYLSNMMVLEWSKDANHPAVLADLVNDNADGVFRLIDQNYAAERKCERLCGILSAHGIKYAVWTRYSD